jgi:hypothetical protein
MSHLAVHQRDQQDGSGKTLWGPWVCFTLKRHEIHPRLLKRRAPMSAGFTFDRSKVTCGVCLRLTRLP